MASLPSPPLPCLHRVSGKSAPLRQSFPISVRSSKADGPIRRPTVPLKEAPRPQPPPSSPSPPSPSPSPSLSSPPPPPSSLATSESPPSTSSPPVSAPAPAPLPLASRSSSSIEYQRQKAKELRAYFLDKKYEEQVAQERVFGWTRKNEIGNGRWAMFGFAVGLLTEYATGSDFVDQMKIIISNLGIADLE